MNGDIKILFVCTGNVFRSMVAEKCFRQYCSQNNLSDFIADSAGIATYPQSILNSVKERLEYYGIKEPHQYKPITTELLSKNDLVVAMHLNHKKYLAKEYDLQASLYNQIAYQKDTGIADIEEMFPEIVHLNNYRLLPQAHKYTQEMVDYLHEATPHLIKNLSKISP